MTGSETDRERGIRRPASWHSGNERTGTWRRYRYPGRSHDVRLSSRGDCQLRKLLSRSVMHSYTPCYQRQQAGRAGRRARDALAVFVPSDYPIDRHFVAHPEELFDKPLNELIIDLDSKVIVEAHLQCASQEMPLCFEDEKYFGPHTRELCETRLVKDADGW